MKRRFWKSDWFIGVLVSALFMELLGARGLFVSNALILSVLILFLVVGPGRSHPKVTRQEHYYTTTPEAALGISELDPRNTEFEESSEVGNTDEEQLNAESGNEENR